MKTISVTQGSAEWHAFRADHNTASDAPAMIGVSKYKTRTQLLEEKFTGLVPEVSEYQQGIFNQGHEAEALARPIAESIVEDDLFPATGESDETPTLGASFDGITMDESIIFEHKLINEELKEATAETLHEMYKIQMDHQLYVSGAEKCLFMASDGTTENCNWFWYERDESRINAVINGWKQFDSDLKDFTPGAPAEVVTGAAPESLPALRIQVTGMVTASNLEEFRSTALAVFEGINRDLKTDQDFANAEKTVKWCGEVETKLATAKKAALEQTESIDQLFRAIDEVAEEARQTRLQLDKLVKARKTAIRAEIAQEAADAMMSHIKQINETLGGKITLPNVPADFNGAIKGKKTVASLRDAVNTELARAKIEANRIADQIRANLTILRTESQGYERLFADAQQLVMKASDDLSNLIKARIAEHKAEEEKRLEAEREKIRAEEQARAKREQDAKEAAQRDQEAKEAAQKAASERELQSQSEPVQEVARRTIKKPAAVIPESKPEPRKVQRPSDMEIIVLLANHYKVSTSVVTEWISTMALDMVESA